MASQNGQKLEEKLSCAICLEVFKAPTTILCGHNFCMQCINDHWDKRNREETVEIKVYDCPQCRKTIAERPALSKNIVLSEIVECVKSGQKIPLKAVEEILGDQKCTRHNMPLVLYCITEKMCICLRCSLNECKDHNKVMLEDERKRVEVKLTSTLTKYSQQIVEFEKDMQLQHEQKDSFKKYADQMKTGILNKITQLSEALESCQEKILGFIGAEEMTAVNQAMQNIKILEEKCAKLKQHQIYIELLLKNTDDIKVLQEWQFLCPQSTEEALPVAQFDAKHKLSAVMSVLTQVSALVLTDLQTSIESNLSQSENEASAKFDKCDLTKMEPTHLIKQGSQTEESEFPPQSPLIKVPKQVPHSNLRENLLKHSCHLTFDPKTAHQHLHIFKDNRKVKHKSLDCHNLPDDPERFKHAWQVLCSESLFKGEYYWEIRFSDYWLYLGVAYKRIERKAEDKRWYIGLNEDSWSLQLFKTRYAAWHKGEEVKLEQPTPMMLGVHLNIPAGTLSFYAIEENMKLIHTFHAVFTEPLYPAFWIGEDVTVSLY
ncbi:tripartite motif-containing protein 65 [Protopterus annectens]|uniref:tripartite motif-containing protein 65 n=1 Tax=Protopterus annectens TaxID=7888 RepID=UPI001CF94C34|nr:tripartite motif-containing protein 65 [Protopterus annectens]